MKNGSILLIPMIFSFFYALFKSPKKAFLYIYLPCLLLFPARFELIISGKWIPILNANTGVMLAILPTCLFWYGKEIFKRMSYIDALVFFFCIWGCFDDIEFSKPKARIFSFIISMLTTFFPYLLAKTFFFDKEWREKFSRCLVGCLLVNCLLLNLEYIFKQNIYNRIFDWFFASNNWYIIGSSRFRFGFIPRLTGPYTGPIQTGMISLIGLFLSVFSIKSQRRLIPTSKVILILIFCLGVFYSGSRGPWFGGFVAYFLAAACKSRFYQLSFLMRFCFLSFAILCLIGPFMNYINPSNSWNTSEEQGSAIYRYQMHVEYFKIMAVKPLFGWGFNPTFLIKHMESTDSHYLYLGLTYGLPVLFAYIFLVLRGAILSLKMGMLKFGGKRWVEERRFCFSLFAIYTMIIIATGTVWLSGHTFTIFMLVVALSEHWFKVAKSMKREEKQRLVSQRRELREAYA